MMLELIGIAIVLGLLAYLPALNGPPIWDDNHAILGTEVRDGKWSRPFGWRGIRGLPFPRWPTQFSWALSFRFLPPGIRWQALHLGNVLLHIVYALLSIPLANTLGLAPEIVVPLVVLSPLAVPAVASVSQRANVLSQVALLGGVFWYIYNNDTPILITKDLLFLTFCLFLAVWAKEDAIGLPILGLLLTPFGRTIFAEYTDDKHQRGSRQSATLPWREHLAVTISNLWRLPCWVVGIATSGDHSLPESLAEMLGTPKQIQYRKAICCGAGFVIAVSGVLLFGGATPRIILALVLISPFWIYVIIPTSHPVMESRAYSLALPAALAIAKYSSAPLVWICLFAVIAARRARLWASVEFFWKDALHPNHLRAHMELAGFYANNRLLIAADQYHQGALRIDPKSCVTWINRARIAHVMAKMVYWEASEEYELTGKRGEKYANFKQWFSDAIRMAEHAKDLCPDDEAIAKSRIMILDDAVHFGLVRVHHQ
jgi:hypothetical protein